MKLGIFFFQLTELAHGFGDVAILGQQHPIGQNRLKHRCLHHFFCTKALSGEGALQTGNCTDAAGFHLIGQFIFRAGIDSQLICFFSPIAPTVLSGKQRFYPQRSTGDLQVGQTGSLRVPGNFINPGPKIGRILRLLCQFRQILQQFLHAFQLQGGTKSARKRFSSGNYFCDRLIFQCSLFQILLQQPLIAQGKSLLTRIVGGIHIYTLIRKTFL